MADDLNLGGLKITLSTENDQPTKADFEMPDGSVVTRYFPATGEVSMRLGLGISLTHQVAQGGGEEEPTAPAQFQDGDWSVADKATGGTITITVSTLPNDGGSAITDLEYQIDGGTWTSLGGTTTGSYDVSGLTDDVAVSVAIRAVNAVGAGTASATKAVTPTAAATLSLVYTNSGALSSSANPSFTSVPFGAEPGAGETRHIFVSVVARHSLNSSQSAISALTIGGVTASLVHRRAASTALNQEIWCAEVPTGTSGTVAITCSHNRWTFAAYRVIGLMSITPHQTLAAAGTINVPEGGFVLVACGSTDTGTAGSLSGATTDYSNGNTQIFGVHGSVQPGPAQPLALSYTGGGASAMIAVSMR